MPGPRSVAAAAAIFLTSGALAGSAGGAEWTFEKIGRGIKPALAIDASDAPHVAFLTELMDGAVLHATFGSGGWRTVTVANGYFYGPVDIDVTADGRAFIAYHDHEATSFRPELGSGVVVFGRDGAWESAQIEDPGHDQWDTDIAVEDDGTWHLAGIDPQQFGSADGLEYATNAYGAARVEQVGSGPLPYEFGVSIEVAPGGAVGISYFDAGDADLGYAERAPGESGGWTITTVDSGGDVGRYSSLAYDGEGNPHISYFAATGGGGGMVRYARRGADGTWGTEDIGPLADVRPGMTGARKITSLAIDGAGRPHVMFSDRAVVVYGARVNGRWSINTVFESSNPPLGQLIEFALDGQDRPHATFFEVTSTSGPLMGDIVYATATD